MSPVKISVDMAVVQRDSINVMGARHIAVKIYLVKKCLNIDVTVLKIVTSANFILADKIIILHNRKYYNYIGTLGLTLISLNSPVFSSITSIVNGYNAPESFISLPSTLTSFCTYLASPGAAVRSV